MLTLVVLFATCLHTGDALSVATSTGGLASSTSAAAGNSSVVTTTVATQGGTAVANQSATKGQHSKTVVAVGDTVLTVQHDEPAGQTWEATPACPFSPTGACHALCMECCKHTSRVGSCMLACMRPRCPHAGTNLALLPLFLPAHAQPQTV